MKRTVPLVLGVMLGAIIAMSPAAAQDDGPDSTTTTTTTTTIQLSAPTATSTVPPEAPTTTVAAVVLGAQESNDGELAMTGLDAGVLAAFGLALLAAGGGAVARARRD